MSNNQDTLVKKLYDEYKQTEQYEEFRELIQKENPDLFVSSIELILYSYWFENIYSDYCDIHGLPFVSLIDQEVERPEVVKGEIKGIDVLSVEEIEKLPKIKGYEPLLKLPDLEEKEEEKN